MLPLIWRMRPRGRIRTHAASTGNGFSMIELTVVIGILGVVMAAGIPNLMNYWQSATLKAGAEEFASTLNRGRQLAIRTNNFVCVERTSNNVRFRTATAANCTGTIWTGPGTDANGWMSLANNVQVNTGPNVIFTFLGAANPGGTYTVLHAPSNSTLSVTVVGSGRVSIGP